MKKLLLAALLLTSTLSWASNALIAQFQKEQDAQAQIKCLPFKNNNGSRDCLIWNMTPSSIHVKQNSMDTKENNQSISRETLIRLKHYFDKKHKNKL